MGIGRGRTGTPGGGETTVVVGIGGPVVVVIGGPVVVVVGGPVVVGVVGGGPVVVVVGGGVVVEVGGMTQFGRVMTLVSRLTWPLRASTRPFTVVPVCTDIEVNAMIVPTKVVLVPKVAELPTCQNTLHGEAPLIRATVLLDAVINVDPAWKIHTALGSPCASRVTVPVRPIGPAVLYTPPHQGQPTEIRRHPDRGRPARRIVVRGGQIVLRLQSNGVRDVHGSIDHLSRRKPGYRAPRGDPEIPGHGGRTGVSDRAARQHREGRRGPQPHRGLRGRCDPAPNRQCDDGPGSRYHQ